MLLQLDITIGLVIVILYSVAGDQCPQGWFDCGTGKCIALSWLCDGEDDCLNFKDESDCDNNSTKSHSSTPAVINCPKDHFACNETSFHPCLPIRWRCDGHKDCPGGGDEKDCKPAQVPCHGFLCKNMQCIPSRWHCDRSHDCDDGSDEENCPKQCIQGLGFFQCKGGDCLPHDMVCNGRPDCPNGEDEEHCANGGCKTKTCSHGCRPTKDGGECYCLHGYELGSDNRTCFDIDECQIHGDGFCSQICTNEAGGYQCSCMTGYRKHHNHSCVVDGPEPILLFSTGDEIRGYYIHSSRAFTVHKAVSQAIGLDMDNANERVFWVDRGNSNPGVYAADLTGRNHKLIISGLKNPEDVAIDWVGRNLYITDPGAQAITVCRLSGSLCATLIRDINNPRAIVLDPVEGEMYWTDWSDQHPGLFSASMDGEAIKDLVHDGIIWPNGLTLDHTKNRLYWSDAKLNKIEYLDLKTHQRKILIQDSVFHPFSMAVFEDELFFTDWETLSLEYCNKFTGHGQTSLFRDHSGHYLGIHVFHPILQPMHNNPCYSHKCSHMCLINSRLRYSCKCPDDMVLDADLATCRSKTPNATTFTGCEDDTAHCGDGQCIPKQWFCDGEVDCLNAADEFDCDTISCKEHEFQCANGEKCISSTFVCDKVPDCDDDSDEADCPHLLYDCPEDLHECRDGICIYKSDLCDGHKDCTGGEDEENCLKCGLEDHICVSGNETICVHNEWLCDGDSDCDDLSDEHHPSCANRTQEKVVVAPVTMNNFDSEVAEGPSVLLVISIIFIISAIIGLFVLLYVQNRRSPGSLGHVFKGLTSSNAAGLTTNFRSPTFGVKYKKDGSSEEAKGLTSEEMENESEPSKTFSNPIYGQTLDSMNDV